VDGNSAGRVTGRGGSLDLSANPWASGFTLWLRWIESNDSGNDHGLAIDNFSFAVTPVPEPGTLAMWLATDRPWADKKAHGEYVEPSTAAGSQPSTYPASQPSTYPGSQPSGLSPAAPAPPPTGGLAFGRPLDGGEAEMAFLDGRYGDLNADPLLRLGADVRLAYWSAGALFFPMQGDVYAAVHPIEHVMLSTAVGLRGRIRGPGADDPDGQSRFGVRDVWLMTHEWPVNAYARAGRFLPQFGWRLDDHTAFTRRPFGLSQEDPANRVLGTEIGFNLQTRDFLLLYFFAAIGLNADIKTLLSGGWPLLILVGTTVGYMILQNLTGIGMAALLGLFHQVSPGPWLQPTPELLAQTARCEAQVDRGARQRCTQQVVAAHRARAPQATRAGLIEALEGLGEVELGGHRLRYGPGERNGSSFVEPTIITHGGRFMR
jgi:hypothetical protein